jgi:hypothetical protein
VKLYPEVYRAGREPALLTVPPLPVLAVEGEGAPEGTAYREAVEALYGVSYALRFALDGGYPVSPLEGQWWGPDGVFDITTVDRASWRWTMLIAQPPAASDDLVAEAVATTRRKRPTEGLARLERRTLDEGLSAQVLHIGPYAAERPTIERLLAFVAGRGLTPTGRHHEIYLSHPARTAPEKLKTIIRHPVAAA